MGIKLQLDGVPQDFVEMYLVAKNWWQGDGSRLLPGETGNYTVFSIEFYDGCRYFGYTKGGVMFRAASLVIDLGGWGKDDFVERHARRMPYVLVCVRSGLDEGTARELRGLLVKLAPINGRVGSRTVVEVPSCWLRSGCV